VFSINPYEAYRQATKAVLPGARIVADHFHLDCSRRKRSRSRWRAHDWFGHKPVAPSPLVRRIAPGADR